MPPVDFAQLPFNEIAHLQQRLGEHWQELEVLNAALASALPAPQLQFVAQDKALLDDGLSFEQRIAERGLIATRVGSLHDFYSALMWLRFPKIKLAMHQVHLRGIQAHGNKTRSRQQQAITHLDEAGAWLVSNDERLLELAGAHAWTELFLDQKAAWQGLIAERIEARVFGHAIFEHMHAPHLLLAAKVVWVYVPDSRLGVTDQRNHSRLGVTDQHNGSYFNLSNAEKDQLLDELIAPNIASDHIGSDPKLLSTVPLSGIPGWCAAQDLNFYNSAPCFRAKPPGRVYAPALKLN
jgi:Protein of unknown function (DUF3025)